MPLNCMCSSDSNSFNTVLCQSRISLILIALLFSLANSKATAQGSGLFHRTYSSKGKLDSPTLVLVLHGDSPFGNPSYQYAIARTIANENQNVVAVGILRPGYIDDEGNRSEGERGNTTGDNYTPEVMKAIQKLTSTLKEKHQPSKVLLVGHSGGAAISANLISTDGASYQGAVLVSCPCDLKEWRKHMKGQQPNTNIWDMKVDSLSPIEELKGIDDKTPITIIHGDQDPVAPFSQVQNYVEKLKESGKNVAFIRLENLAHEVAFNPQVFKAVSRFIQP